MLALLLAFAAAPPPLDLASLAAALEASPAWRVEFVQHYLPAGFASGTREGGTLLLVPPARLRFDYRGATPRVFAVDGSVARLVDEHAGTCDAVAIDRGAWERLPLAALLDPAAARQAFLVEERPGELRLVPRHATQDVAEILVTGTPGLPPTRLVIVDPAGNRNEFVFSHWTRTRTPQDDAFRPHLPGAPPCQPVER